MGAFMAMGTISFHYKHAVVRRSIGNNLPLEDLMEAVDNFEGDIMSVVQTDADTLLAPVDVKIIATNYGIIAESFVKKNCDPQDPIFEKFKAAGWRLK